MMPDDRSHQGIRELLPAVALESAAPEERDAVLAHAKGCAECRAELGALREASGLVGLSLPSRGSPDLGRVRSRLLARIADGRTANTHAPRRAPGRSPWWLAAAAVIGLVAVTLALRSAMRERDLARSELVASDLEIDRLRDSLAATESMLGALTGPSVQVVNLAATGLRDPRGRMFWDQVADRWTLVAHDLPAPAAGRTYQLWVITTAGEKVSAGTFEPVAGRALVQATYALPRDQLSAIAVTEEPAGGVPQPTGAIVIAGSPG